MITIMTPTYNRAYILGQAYRSLCEQTSFEFEWIIIDDGSSDGTSDLVNKWIDECKDFHIIYYQQQNGGKHRAINNAVQMAQYEWFFILDSDDQLTTTAVEMIHAWINNVSGIDEIVGVAGLKSSCEHAIGGNMKKAYVDATNLQRKKFGLLGDKAEVYKTKILKQYPFPEFQGENFIRESAVWDKIAKEGWKIRWFNNIIYICEYIEDGLTKNTNFETYAKNFQGFTYCAKLYIETHSWVCALNKCGEFYSVAKRKKIRLKESAKILGVSNFFYIIGILCFNLKEYLKKL